MSFMVLCPFISIDSKDSTVDDQNIFYHKKTKPGLLIFKKLLIFTQNNYSNTHCSLKRNYSLRLNLHKYLCKKMFFILVV